MTPPTADNDSDAGDSIEHVDGKALTAAPNRKRQIVKAGVSLVALVLVYLFATKFTHTAWPFAHANVLLLVLAGVLILTSYLFRAVAWQRLFVAKDRPDRSALMTATGAASLSGNVLPGRLDWAVKIFVLRRMRPKHAKLGLEAIGVSLGSLALLDAVSMSPLATTAIITEERPLLRIALGIVLFCGLAAAVVYFMAGRILNSGVCSRWPRVQRRMRAAAEAVVGGRDVLVAIVALSACWACRCAGSLFLLAALNISFSPTLAVLFVCLSAASVAINFVPLGAAFQVGAGTGILLMAHVRTADAASFALASNLLFMLCAAAGMLAGVAWYSTRSFIAAQRA